MPDSTALVDAESVAAAAVDVAGSRRPPVVTASAVAPAELAASTLVVVVRTVDGKPGPAVAAVAACADVGIDLGLLLAAEEAKADAGSAVVVPLARVEVPTRLVVVGAGDGSVADWRAAGATSVRRSTGRRVAVVGVLGPEALAADAAAPGAAAPAGETVSAFAVGAALAAYRQPTVFEVAPPVDPVVVDVDAVVEVDGDIDVEVELGGELAAAEVVDAADSGSGSKGGVREVVLVATAGSPVSPELVATLAAADVVARAVYLARDLINTPAQVATPAWLAAKAVELGAESGLEVTVLGPNELAEGGFGGLLSVGKGAVNPPRLVRLSYQGPAPTDGSDPGHRVLVGKGITFDTGGLSLKPSASMVGMKTDMAGSAAVLATMTTLAGLGAPGRVTGLMCLAENAFGGNAMRPGDVITCYGGTTVEVLNTDAEGRLVLADGLAYAAANLAPDVMVDLATLTGAISIALGRRTAGLFSSDDALSAALSAASERAGERVWRLPLVDEYRPAIVSPVADLANIGRYLDVSGGSITAALFLREFTTGLPWAHLDIAGTARSDSDDGEISRGATGWGVRTLVTWLTA